MASAADEAMLRQAVETNDAMIEEKANTLRAVAAEIQDLNGLFLELGHLVLNQGSDVETIATLVEETAEDVARARQELQLTERQEANGCIIQ